MLLEQILELQLRLVGRVVDGRLLAVASFSEIARLLGLKTAESTSPALTSAIACEVVSLPAFDAFGIRVWLASQTSKTITMSGKNALRKKRFTIVLRSG